MKILKIIISVLAVLVIAECMGQNCSCSTKTHVPKERIHIGQIIFDGKLNELKKVDPTELKCSDNSFESYLLYAVRANQIEIIKFLIELGLDINHPNESGGNALHYCSGDTVLETLLIENGIEINKQDARGITPIMYAAKRGSIESVRYFIDNHADLHLKDYEGKTVVDYANGVSKIENNEIYKPIQALLKSHGANSGYILREAVITGDMESFKEILESKKAKPDAKDQFGSTVLVYTCNVEFLSILFDYGLDLNIKNQDDLTGLMFAARHGCYEAVEFYLNHGVDVNAKKGSRTALDNATSEKIIELLIAHGARKGNE